MTEDQKQSETEDLQTPGQILKAAREVRGYQQSAVAERLRLSVQTIKDIESDDYTHFPAEIYLRGHLRSYARMVEADPAIVLKAFENMGIQIEKDPHVPVLMAQNISVSRRAHRTKRKTLLWASLSVLLILIVMVVLWWQEQQGHPFYSEKISLPIETKPVDTASAPAVVSPPAVNTSETSEPTQEGISVAAAPSSGASSKEERLGKDLSTENNSSSVSNKSSKKQTEPSANAIGTSDSNSDSEGFVPSYSMRPATQ